MELRQSFLIRSIIKNPRISAWVVLSLGMIILLVIEAHDVGLTLGNWIALIIATILVAGACIWIVSWEDVDESDGIPTSEGETPLPPSDVTQAYAEPEKNQDEALSQ
jgi:hypothetical protein